MPMEPNFDPGFAEAREQRTPRANASARREFIKEIAGAVASATVAWHWPGVSRARAAPAVAGRVEGRKLKYVGWQVGVTYQATARQGRDRDSLMRLLDEMAQHRMNLLSLMMISHGFYDPNHDGYCWPVRNPRLKHYWDSNSINGRESTEFVRDVIAAAADRGIETQLFMNWGIWNPDRIQAAYPAASPQINRQEALAAKTSKYWLHCPDSPGAWQAGLDEVADLLTYYDHPNVTSYGLERLSYGGAQYCFCPHTQEKYRQEMGASIFDESAAGLEAWKRKHVGDYLSQYVEHIKRVKPDAGTWLHTQCAAGWGHDPPQLKACGIDYVVPHTIQFRETKLGIHQKLERLAPNPCVLHFCTRDRRPANYPLWIKTPEIIAEVIDWVLDYPGDNLAGIMFFNENATSPRNKEAAYEQIKRFQW
ncbi:MAG: hypothetical protein ABIP48_23800 [Planctomycetota bacterium]